MKKRKIALITDSRCSHSLYTPVLDAISNTGSLDYHYIVTGMHLRKEFGETIETINNEGYKIGAKINFGYGGLSLKGEAVAIGNWVCAFAKEFSKAKPDIILVQGDRGVSLAGAIAGSYMNIPVAHMFGGEVSSSIDDSARHAITKLSHVHFPESRESAKRIAKLGEQQWRIHLAGSTGVEQIHKKELYNAEEVAAEFGLDLRKPVIVLLQHAVSFEVEYAGLQILETMKAIKGIAQQTIAVYPNDDAGSRDIAKAIEQQAGNNPGFLFKAYKNIPYRMYLSLLRCSSVLVGNSSGGIIEAPSLGLPVVNIGSRQANRERAANVIDAGYDSLAIKKAIKKCLAEKNFIASAKKAKSPYDPFGTHDAGKRIVHALAELKIDRKLLAKQIAY